MSEWPSESSRQGGRPAWGFVVAAVVLATTFARLGVWQVDRLAERRAENRLLEARLESPAQDLTAVLDAGAAPGDLAWRRLRVAGTWDLDQEIVVRGRAHQGVPGVHVVTPLVYRPDSAILVLRGWLPAADGLSADFAAARPGRAAARIEALALPGESPSGIPPRRRAFQNSERLVLGTLAVEQAAASLSYHLLPVYLLAPESGEAPGSPIAVGEPALTSGPHLWYAVQWFAFALISLIGALVYIRTRRRSAVRKEDRE